MPRGGKRPGAGRPPGSPNKTTAEDREAFRLIYERKLTDFERWIGETGDGWSQPLIVKGIPIMDDKGKPVMVTVGKDPGKAADIMSRLAEHFVPKLQRHEHTGQDGAAIVWKFESE